MVLALLILVLTGLLVQQPVETPVRVLPSKSRDTLDEAATMLSEMHRQSIALKEVLVHSAAVTSSMELTAIEWAESHEVSDQELDAVGAVQILENTASDSAKQDEARTCSPGCTQHGNCNQLTGECMCGLTHTGPSCSAPTMPACALPPGELGEPDTPHRLVAHARCDDLLPSTDAEGADAGDVINLSGMASEAFWSSLRDIGVHDPRRKQPPCAACWTRATPADQTSPPPQRVGSGARACAQLSTAHVVVLLQPRRQPALATSPTHQVPLARGGDVRVRPAGPRHLPTTSHHPLTRRPSPSSHNPAPSKYTHSSLLPHH